MPTFSYKAKDGPDRTVDGEVSAENRAAAVARVEALGYSPVWVRESASTGGLRPFRTRILTRDINVFTRQLAGLLKAGVPILRALATIQEQTESQRFQGVVQTILATVREGRMLSEALAVHPRLFSELYVNMVRSGESGGVLDEILLRLAEAREKDDELRTQVRSALAYPLLVLTVGIVSVVVILTFFLPRIAQLFVGTQTPLPWPTRLLIGLSGFISTYWIGLLAMLICAWLAFRKWTAGEKGRARFDAWLLEVPLVGRFLRDADLVRFARTLALLIQAGVPIERALSLSGQTMANLTLRLAVAGVARDTILAGTSLATGLRRWAQIPVFVTNMVAVGEESGQLDTTLEEVARFYQRELDRDLRLATTLLEPLLILAVGVVIGFIIFAMLLPIFELGQTLR